MSRKTVKCDGGSRDLQQTGVYLDLSRAENWAVLNDLADRLNFTIVAVKIFSETLFMNAVSQGTIPGTNYIQGNPKLGSDKLT